MKIHEVLEQRNPDQWIRPVSMAGSGYAYTVTHDLLCMVPSAKGASPAYAHASDLIDDRVIVSPDVVIAECEKWLR